MPLLSLVICTYNRQRYLPGSLEGLSQQTSPNADFEVIIIDNASTDRTSQIAKSFIENHPSLNVRYVFEENKGLSFARNRGIKEANAPLIAYVDDDVILTPDYVQNVTDFFKKNPHAMGAGGKVIPKYEEGHEPVWMSKYLFGFVGNVNHGESIKIFDKSMRYPVGCNMIYKKEILEKAGGFNNDLRFRSDDKYIYYKVAELSKEIYYLPQAWLFHYIDAHRLEIENFRKLFLKTGNEEKRRVRAEHQTFGVLKKFFEFLFKWGASLILLLMYTAKGQYPKGKYVYISQWSTLKGFLQKDVFVR